MTNLVLAATGVLLLFRNDKCSDCTSYVTYLESVLGRTIHHSHMRGDSRMMTSVMVLSPVRDPES